MRRSWLILLLLLTSSPAEGATTHWVGAWAAAPQPGGAAGDEQSYRLLVHTSTGGAALRLRFTNRYGTAPVVLRDVTVGLPVTPVSPDLQRATMRSVRFRSGSSLTMAPGTSGQSLPLPFAVPADAWLAVSFHAPGSFATTTAHATAWGFNWQTLPGSGDHASEPAGTAFQQPLVAWPYLTGVDVTAPRTVSTVVALGDSITDCCYSTPHGSTRWPDLLNRRFAAAAGGQRLTVVNAGINGNLASGDNGANGEAGDKRVLWDLLDVPGVSTVILALGVNDIGMGRTPTQIIASYQRILRVAHRNGIRVVVATITPTSGAAVGNPSEATFRGTREAVNDWVSQHRCLFDGVIPFGRAVESAASPDLWEPGYTIGDQTHPNPVGLQVMADAVPLDLFS